MNSFNYQQKIAMMRILLDIIHADGRIDAREMFFFNQLKDVFMLPENSHCDVEDKNTLLALVQIKAFNNDQKILFSELMSKMIVIDEDIDANEIALYNIVRELTEINAEFNKDIILTTEISTKSQIFG